MPYTTRQKIAELKRELYWRGRVYPDRVADGRMKIEDSHKYVTTMQEILEDYEAKLAKEEPPAPDLFAGSDSP